MTTSLTIPSHYTRTSDGITLETWECVCGATGVQTDNTTASQEARAHQRDEARQILVDLDAEQFGALLRRSAESDWRVTAAVELLIRHETWLYDETLRQDYLDATWTPAGDLVLRIEWMAVASTAGLIDIALRSLFSFGLDNDLIAEIQQFEDGTTDGRAPLDGSESEIAILRVAASIAGGLPIRLHEDTTSLDTRNRGLVLTAIGHLLSHGGGVQFDSATTWSQLPQRRRHDYC